MPASAVTNAAAMRRVHEAQARRANAQAEGKHRSGDRHERVIRKVPFRLVHKLVDPDSAAPGQAITVSRLQGSEADLKALLTVARHDELSSALQAFDAYVLCAQRPAAASVDLGFPSLRQPRDGATRVCARRAVHRFADLEDSAGGCLCWTTAAPDLSEHPLWAEVAAYNQYYHTSSLRFVASPNDDYPTEVIISGGTCKPAPPIVRVRGWVDDTDMPSHGGVCVQRHLRSGSGPAPATATCQAACWLHPQSTGSWMRRTTRRGLLRQRTCTWDS